jgi:uncharacterized protein (TIGR03083 family)
MTVEFTPLAEEDLRSALVAAGARMSAAASAAGLKARVPSCPEWEVRDLLRHTSGVHRWATRHVAEAIAEYLPESADLEAFHGGWPADDELIAWFDEGLEALVGALEQAPEDLECWSFLAAPSPRWFWARRQAHETTMHARDAELALGAPTPIDAVLCADGLDELLCGFVPRMRRRLSGERVERLVVSCVDTGHAFTLTIGEAGTATERGATAVEGATSLSGSAEDLYLWGWSRQGRGHLAITGDPAVVEHFEQAVHVNW